MIGRRDVLSGLTTRIALPVPASDRLVFQIVRKGDRIGEHSVGFQRDGNRLTVSVAADIAISLGPIVVFRYRHRCTEVWDRDQVVSVDAVTNDDGSNQHMTARRDDSGLWVDGSGTRRYRAPAQSLPGTHWNRAMLDAPFINTQDGRLMNLTVTPAGRQPVPDGRGTVQADMYRLRGIANLDTFYDAAPSWVGLRFQARDGSEVIYQRS